MGMYQPEIETMDRNELEKLQLERLQKQVKNVYEMFRCTEKEWIKRV